ncbi:DNA mismatch repair protein Mlh1-like [Dermacentor albipictus]|uniref:DNA mismatch repair protein Mlh1-like n=1 Tax=Dermacentor albipictus TaxID=60249 RepID=UPI0038FD2BBA
MTAPLEPGKIRRLDETVTNRIAAGEVVQRPVNALKEMLENSIDAKSTSIQVVAKSGGLKLLQIKDNGCGIRKEDLDIVCERFTTSKLVKFEDLGSIATYGFRGEALASISYVARVSITTKTEDSKCAYKLSYLNGKPTGPARPCAGNRGTLIVVEDLFYNVPTRKNAFKSPGEEYRRIVDMVSRYAVHNAGIAMSVRQADDSSTDVNTANEASALQNIECIYGKNVSRELLTVECAEANLKFKMTGLVSNANCSYKKCTMLLFINHRLVESATLRKAIESVYASYLPKNAHPWLYLSLEIHPANVDVNVHPTKREVHFLHEELILESIQKAVDSALLSCNSSRTFLTQACLPRIVPTKSVSAAAKKADNAGTSTSVDERHMVRTDSQMQKLDAFLKKPSPQAGKKNSSQPARPDEPDDNSDDDSAAERPQVKLQSVTNLWEAVIKNSHAGLRELFRNHTFVGCVNQRYSLVQHKTELYIINTRRVSEELFYQLMLKNFGRFGLYQLSEPAPIYDLAMMALGLEECGWTEADGPKEELARYMSTFLTSKAEMLEDYFSLGINESGEITSLPIILNDHTPPVEGLPMYALRLATEVEWEKEQECFETFCRETARFYAAPTIDVGQADDPNGWKWVTEHVVFPAAKQTLRLPVEYMENSCVLQVASLPNLYKVFERC